MSEFLDSLGFNLTNSFTGRAVTVVMAENDENDFNQRTVPVIEDAGENTDYFEKIGKDPAAKKLDEAAQKILDELKSDK